MTVLARQLVHRGCDELFICGSTGELPLLDSTSRALLVAAAREDVSKDTVIHGGISGCGVQEVLHHAVK